MKRFEWAESLALHTYEENYLEAFEDEGMEEVAHSPALLGMLGFDVVLEERGENGR